MKLIFFSKMLSEFDAAQLVGFAEKVGVDGYDLCVRPGHPVNPDNVERAMPELVAALRENGFDVPMITGNFDLLEPEHPTARPILKSMAISDVRLLKLGYFSFDPRGRPYLEEVGRIRRIFERWELLGREYGVKACYHTHSGSNMGMNCAALAHLVSGRDPQYTGAYVDPGHMLLEGERFATGAAMVRDYLSIVALKDVKLEREEQKGHGRARPVWVNAGEGMVDWSEVFATLANMAYEGPLTVHYDFELPPEEYIAAVGREVSFYRNVLSQHSGMQT